MHHLRTRQEPNIHMPRDFTKAPVSAGDASQNNLVILNMANLEYVVCQGFMVAPAVALMRVLGKKEMLCVACMLLAIINAGLAMIPAHIVQQARGHTR